MLPPEVVLFNSTAVHVIWTSPSKPDGTVAASSLYVNNQLYKAGMDAPGSVILEGLCPFTAYDIQFRAVFSFLLDGYARGCVRQGTPSRARPLSGGPLSRLQAIVYLLGKGSGKKEIDQNEGKLCALRSSQT